MWNPNIKDVLERMLKAVKAKNAAENELSYIVTTFVTDEIDGIIEKTISEHEYIDIQYNAKELQERYDELHSQYYGDNMNWLENAEWSYLITYLLETLDKDK